MVKENEVLLTSEGLSSRWKQYIHTTQNTNLISLKIYLWENWKVSITEEKL